MPINLNNLKFTITNIKINYEKFTQQNRNYSYGRHNGYVIGIMQQANYLVYQPDEQTG